ncbi:hypothetical protein VNI00_018754 [Paramarasmius palmivorus]|uniref:Uncharacterized protein n=1 Tax=Paramarasmius palmivorus TaxID=297713 RepID=A0AAW0AVS9_9AGAR
MPSDDNDSDDILLEGFKLRGESQMRAPEELRRYLFWQTPNGQGLVPVAKLHPVTINKRLHVSKASNQLTSSSASESSELGVALASSSTMESEGFEPTQEQESDSDYGKAVKVGSTDSFMCISQYRGRYIPVKSSPVHGPRSLSFGPESSFSCDSGAKPQEQAVSDKRSKDEAFFDDRSYISASSEE